MHVSLPQNILLARIRLRLEVDEGGGARGRTCKILLCNFG